MVSGILDIENSWADAANKRQYAANVDISAFIADIFSGFLPHSSGII